MLPGSSHRQLHLARPRCWILHLEMGRPPQVATRPDWPVAWTALAHGTQPHVYIPFTRCGVTLRIILGLFRTEIISCRFEGSVGLGAMRFILPPLRRSLIGPVKASGTAQLDSPATSSTSPFSRPRAIPAVPLCGRSHVNRELNSRTRSSRVGRRG